MLIPFVGRRDYDLIAYPGPYGRYWSSSPYDYNRYVRFFFLNADKLSADTYNDRGHGTAVRCFKNSYIELPQTFNLNFMANTGDTQAV